MAGRVSRQAWAAFQAIAFARPETGRMGADRYPGVPAGAIWAPGAASRKGEGGRARGSNEGWALQCPVTRRPRGNRFSPAGMDISGHTATWIDAQTAPTSTPRWPGRGVLFGSLDQLVCTHGDLLRPYLFTAVDYHADKFAALARRLLVGRHGALRAQGRGDRSSAAHAFGALARRRRPGTRADRARRGRRSDGAGRDGQRRCRGPGPALRRD